MHLKELMQKVRVLDQQGNKEEARSLSNHLLQEFPREAHVWSLRGLLYAKERNYKNAILALTSAIEISPDSQFFLMRGHYYFDAGDNQMAIKDFYDSLLKNISNDQTYKEYINFWLAESYIKIRNKREALHALSQVSNGYKTFTFAMRSKQDLLTDCSVLDFPES